MNWIHKDDPKRTSVDFQSGVKVTTIINTKGPVVSYDDVCNEAEACAECDGSGYVYGSETSESKGTLCRCAAVGDNK